MIKLKDLLEQTKKYKSAEMRGTFSPNYVTPNPGWKKDFDPIINNIKGLQGEGYTLDQINVIIKSGASPDTASNRYLGSKKPNHNFVKYGVQDGGLLPNVGWVKPPAQRITIEKGNEFLAAERGRQLKSLIVPLLKKTFPGIPVENIIVDPKLNSEKFASYQVETKGTAEEKPSGFNVKLMDKGAGYSRPFYFLPGENPIGHSNGESLFFNWRLLAKASAVKQRLSTNPNQTFNAMDYGLGDGVSVYVSKNAIEQARSAGKVTAKVADSYGGDPADYEQAIWKMIQYGNSPEGKNNDKISTIYKKPLLLDKMPGRNGAPWRYIDPKTGKIKVKQPIKA